MKPRRGQMLVRFTREQIENHNHPSRIIKDLKVENPANPNDFSIEEAEVFATNEHQTFFEPGDRVLISFIVFQQGKHQRFQKGVATRKLHTEANGDEIYWCHDGTDSWNGTECFARWSPWEQEWLMHSGWAVIAQPAIRERTAGGLFIPPSIQKEDRTKERVFWARILAMHPDEPDAFDPAGNRTFNVGTEVLCQGELSYDIPTRKGPLHIIKTKYVIAKKNTHVLT